MVSPLKSFHVLDFENGDTFTFSTRKKKEANQLNFSKVLCLFVHSFWKRT